MENCLSPVRKGEKKKKIILTLILSLCGFLYGTLVEAQVSEGKGMVVLEGPEERLMKRLIEEFVKATAIEERFKRGHFQGESVVTPRFMSGPCYHKRNYSYYGSAPKSAKVLLYPYGDQILFFGNFASSSPSDSFNSMEEIMGEYEKRIEEEKAKIEGVENSESNKLLDSLEGGVALWDQSASGVVVKNSMVHDPEDPWKILLYREFDFIVSHCELEIKKFE